jgi:hypothetical protein
MTNTECGSEEPRRALLIHNPRKPRTEYVEALRIQVRQM